jgi:hypothetical protein
LASVIVPQPHRSIVAATRQECAVGAEADRQDSALMST